MSRSTFRGLLFFMFLSLCICSVKGLVVAGQDESDSSHCINCHTDLEEMDDYGAKAASAAAAVAG